MNHTITVIQKPAARVARVIVDLDKWEQLANVFGFYDPAFLKILKKSIKESKQGKIRKIKSLKELE